MRTPLAPSGCLPCPRYVAVHTTVNNSTCVTRSGQPCAPGRTGPGAQATGCRGADRQCGSRLNACGHIPDPRSVSCSYGGGALHFYERVGIPEARHPDGRHGWVLPSAQAPPHVADLAAMRPVVVQIYRVDGQGDQVTGVTARGPQGCEQVT